MAEPVDPSLAELGEWGLLERIAAFAPPGQLDDDAALLAERAGAVLVINTDVLVEGFTSATPRSPPSIWAGVPPPPTCPILRRWAAGRWSG